MGSGFLGTVKTLLVSIALIWTLFVLYELREAFTDPAAKEKARQRLINDLQHFSQTSKTFFEQGKNALYILTTSYKLQLHVFADNAIAFVQDMTQGSFLEELVGMPAAKVEHYDL
ncbi:hypothetical protein RvY_18576 [Ramazzottius varieornatus]|uniref:Uncharacterized protein n=1 Tax=Ramazzottius varieornatus TaxID=947166 RepID=A0A1D1W699_RAMVA|nr:hypothetical protein RvY_18576 [Ramazzottius varieornatus]